MKSFNFIEKFSIFILRRMVFEKIFGQRYRFCNFELKVPSVGGSSILRFFSILVLVFFSTRRLIFELPSVKFGCHIIILLR